MNEATLYIRYDPDKISLSPLMDEIEDIEGVHEVALGGT